MKVIFILSFCLLTSIYADEVESTATYIQANSKAAIEEMTKGMTPKQRAQFNEQMKAVNQMVEEQLKKSPEEQKKMMLEMQKQLNSPENKDKLKKTLESLSDSEKKMFQEAMKKLNK